MRQKAVINDVEGQLFLTGTNQFTPAEFPRQRRTQIWKVEGGENEGRARNVPWNAGTTRLLYLSYEVRTGHKRRRENALC